MGSRAATTGKDALVDVPMQRFRHTRYQRLLSEGSEGSSSAHSDGTNEPGSPKQAYEIFEDYLPDPDEVGKNEDPSTAPLLARRKSSALAVPGAEKRFWFQRSKVAYDADAVATQPSVFDDPDTLEEYRPSDAWENVHRFDPEERWTWREEFVLIRKIDVKIMLFAAVMFMALELDRSNISQALTDNFLDDLGMTTNGKLTFPHRTPKCRRC